MSETDVDLRILRGRMNVSLNYQQAHDALMRAA